jgi:hypothetical protein
MTQLVTPRSDKARVEAGFSTRRMLPQVRTAASLGTMSPGVPTRTGSPVARVAAANWRALVEQLQEDLRGPSARETGARGEMARWLQLKALDEQWTREICAARDANPDAWSCTIRGAPIRGSRDGTPLERCIASALDRHGVSALLILSDDAFTPLCLPPHPLTRFPNASSRGRWCKLPPLLNSFGFEAHIVWFVRHLEGETLQSIADESSSTRDAVKKALMRLRDAIREACWVSDEDRTRVARRSQPAPKG